MDRSWMYQKQYFVFFQKLTEFISRADELRTLNGDDRIVYPCVVCKNRKKVKSIDEFREHIIFKGFMPDYNVWIWHGEKGNDLSSDNVANLGIGEDNINDVDSDGEDHNTIELNKDIKMNEDNVEDKKLDQIMDDLERHFVDRPDMFKTLVSNSKKPLYPGCKFTRLSAILKLYTLKAGNDMSFTALLELLSEMLPEGNRLPITTYQCKKMLCPLATKYVKFHACEHDHILYREQYSDLQSCPKCGESQYRLVDDGKDNRNGGPVKTAWYLPIIPKIKRVYANPKDAENMLCHEKGRIKDGKLRHVVDSPQWRTIDSTFQEFGKKPRNVRLGLGTDGIKPFGSLSTQHSSWPIMLVIYNLPPWLTTKSKYIMLTMLISDPKQPGNDIDVYLDPLIDDLKLLWNEGVRVFDVATGHMFQMRAMLYCTINDFPAYENLYGYRLKTDKGCRICGDDTESKWLKHSGKYVYMGHRRTTTVSSYLSGEEYYEQVKNINMEFGKPYTPPPQGVYHTKKSIFWDATLEALVRKALYRCHACKKECV